MSEAAEAVKGTSLEGAPIVKVSSLTGEGLEELAGAIDAVLAEAESRPDLGRPRLPVDRVFTMSGFGTVVTGTLVDGTLEVGAELEDGRSASGDCSGTTARLTRRRLAIALRRTSSASRKASWCGETSWPFRAP
jgi:selenocysteine-specific elongation factor